MIARGLIAMGMLVAAVPAVAQTASVAAVGDATKKPAENPLASRVAGQLMPPGTYRKMMKTVMDQVTGAVMNQVMDMPLRDMIKGFGLSGAEAEKLGPGTMRQMMAIMDPAFDQRMQISMRIMGDEITNMMDEVEPDYRAGLADALSARFTPDQLAELDRFFATPTGSAYASQSMLVYADPAMMQRMQALVPKMMKVMPGMMQKVMAATADLPKPRDAKTMTPEQRKQFMALLVSKSDKQ